MVCIYCTTVLQMGRLVPQAQVLLLLVPAHTHVADILIVIGSPQNQAMGSCADVDLPFVIIIIIIFG